MTTVKIEKPHSQLKNWQYTITNSLQIPLNTVKGWQFPVISKINNKKKQQKQATPPKTRTSPKTKTTHEIKQPIDGVEELKQYLHCKWTTPYKIFKMHRTYTLYLYAPYMHCTKLLIN